MLSVKYTGQETRIMDKDLVLIVDDDHAVRTMLCKIMDSNGFNVVQAEADRRLSRLFPRTASRLFCWTSTCTAWTASR